MPNTAPDSSARRVHVAVGVISNGGERILIARRPQHVHQGGLWEFPGGKVESGETVQQALRRELREELAIEIVACEALLSVAHDYADKSVLLDVWWVSAFRGEPQGREGQPLHWADADELQTLSFPAANVPIVAAVAAKLAQLALR